MTNPTTSQIIAAARAVVKSVPGNPDYIPLARFADALERLAKEPEQDPDMPPPGFFEDRPVKDSGANKRIIDNLRKMAPPEPEAGGEKKCKKCKGTGVVGGWFDANGGNQPYQGDPCSDCQPSTYEEPKPTNIFNEITADEGRGILGNIFEGHVPGAVVTRRDGKVGKFLGIRDPERSDPYQCEFTDCSPFYTPRGWWTSRSESDIDITHIAAAEVKGEEKRKEPFPPTHCKDCGSIFYAHSTHPAKSEREWECPRCAVTARNQLTRDLAEARAEVERLKTCIVQGDETLTRVTKKRDEWRAVAVRLAARLKKLKGSDSFYDEDMAALDAFNKLNQ